MYKKTIKIATLMAVFYTQPIFADIDMQKGVYDSAEEMMAMDEKMNRAIAKHNRLNLADEDIEEEPDISIHDFEETKMGYQLIREISDSNQTEVRVQLKEGILTISTIRRVIEKTKFSESMTISSSASSLFIPTDAKEDVMEQSYLNGVLKIKLIKK